MIASTRLILASLLVATSVHAQVELEEKLAGDESRRLLFAPVADVIRDSVVEILDDADRTVALGLVVAPDLVVTKASELPTVPLCATNDGRFIEGELVGLDEELDVAVLALKVKDLIPAKLASRVLDPGRWVVTPGAEGSVWSGVVSVRALSIHRTSAFLGVMLENTDGTGARVTQVVSDSAAEAAGLQANDLIVKLGDDAVTDREQLIALIGKRSPGDRIDVEVMRAEKRETVTVALGRRSGRPGSADAARRRRRFRSRGTEFSRKSSGFRSAFQHDTLLDAADCGGPVVDLRGEVVGLNIARASRTETLAVPTRDLIELVKTVLAERSREAPVAPRKKDDGRVRKRL